MGEQKVNKKNNIYFGNYDNGHIFQGERHVYKKWFSYIVGDLFFAIIVDNFRKQHRLINKTNSNDLGMSKKYKDTIVC